MYEEESDDLLGCLYCGDLRDMPGERAIELLGDVALKCCGCDMIILDGCNLYKLLKGIDNLKESVEKKLKDSF